MSSVLASVTDVREPAMWTTRHRIRGFAIAAGCLFAAVVGSVFVTVAGETRDAIAREIAADHLRALDPGRATDIESPNYVEVSAWFAARIRPVPAVARLDDLGYRLVGGRLDVLAGRRVAAVVYRRRTRAISVYSWVASTRDSTEGTADSVRGVQLLHWQRGTVVTCVASDLSADEVRQFAASLRLAEGVE